MPRPRMLDTNYSIKMCLWIGTYKKTFQATVLEGRLVGMNGVAIPYLYIGLFDGHGGAGCAIKE